MRLDEAARKYLGVPFRHQGRDPAIGGDCPALLRWGLDDIGLHVAASHDRTDYGPDPADGLLESLLRAAFGEPVPKSTIQPADIVAIDYVGAIRHVGIVGEHPQGGLSLIHTNSKVGRVTEARIDAKWLKRIKLVFRVSA